MTNYTPNDTFATVQTFEVSDPVLGGTSGESNLPVKQLADRTQYLYNRLGKYAEHRIITAGASITPADKYKLVHVITANNISLTIDAVSTFKPGDIIEVKAKTTTAGKAVRLVPNGSETIEDGNINHATAGLYLHDGEHVKLMAGDADEDGTPDYWELIAFEGNLYKVAVDDLVRLLPRNSLIAQGQLVNRADYPRLWAAIQATAIDDSTWSGHAVRYRSFFSAGNGTTTFRMPDMRGMFYRALDLSRGIDFDRMDNLAGGYEADEFKSHTHTNGNYNKLVQMNGFNTATAFDNSPGEIDCRTAANLADAGGLETRPKNIGFTPIIYY